MFCSLFYFLSRSVTVVFFKLMLSAEWSLPKKGDVSAELIDRLEEQLMLVCSARKTRFIILFWLKDPKILKYEYESK